MAKKLWGGRFAKKTDPFVEEFTKSIDYDCKMALCDITGSLIHASILKKSKILSNSEAAKLEKSLKKIFHQVERGIFAFDKTCEDVHTNIQNAVSKEAGEAALKLQTARSRNEQVAFDLRLFCKLALAEIEGLFLSLLSSFSEQAKRLQGLIIPGYTHLQHAQLVYVSDYLASYAKMLERDAARMKLIGEEIQLVMGAGALAGTPISSKMYHEHTSISVKGKRIDVKVQPTDNALDSVSDRDFVIEILSGLAILGMHLSRFSEDMILWSTQEFGFIELDDAFTTGSSLMPQKKNPDVLELTRGYAGILYGNLMSVLTTMKGLPLTYNRDMQLDKLPLFGSFDIAGKVLKVLAKLVKTMKWNKDAIAKKIREDETLYATDLVYHLVKKGVSFKKAHDAVGNLVKFSLKSKKRIKDMKNTELMKFSGAFTHKEITKLMDPAASVRSRISVERKK